MGSHEWQPAGDIACVSKRSLMSRVDNIFEGFGPLESMDRWQCGEITQKVTGAGWLAKSVPDLAKGKGGGVPVMHVGSEKLPMACRGTTQGVFTINQDQPFELKLGLACNALFHNCLFA